MSSWGQRAVFTETVSMPTGTTGPVSLAPLERSDAK